MSTHSKWLIGIAVVTLLAGAAVLSREAAGVFLFVVPFTAAVLWLVGITRTPRFVRQKRKIAAEQPRRLTEPHPGVPERQFLEQPKRWARGFLFVTGIVPMSFGLLCLAAAATQPVERGVRGVLVVFGVAMALFGAFMLRFAMRLPQMGVRFGPRGLEAIGILGERRIAWDEIVALSHKTYRMSGQVIQTNFLLYAADSLIEISGKLPGFAEIVAVVEQHAPPQALAE